MSLPTILLEPSVAKKLDKLPAIREDFERDYVINQVIRIWLGLPHDLDDADLKNIADGKPIEI